MPRFFLRIRIAAWRSGVRWRVVMWLTSAPRDSILAVTSSSVYEVSGLCLALMALMMCRRGHVPGEGVADERALGFSR
ncbi:MAG: hypothetical protein J7L75_03695 [Thermoproteales archaeon]|nr:hypothetical protein [Thermoproteales archaeon]